MGQPNGAGIAGLTHEDATSGSVRLARAKSWAHAIGSRRTACVDASVPAMAMGHGRWVCGLWLGCSLACAQEGAHAQESGDAEGVPVPDTTEDDGEDDNDTIIDDLPTPAPGCGDVDLGCTDRIDLLFVIDNSGTMAEEQQNLARNFPRLVERLESLEDSSGALVSPDVQIMVTTTDNGNPSCTQHEPVGYEPARGAPTTTGCNARLEHFTGLGSNAASVPEACTSVCPSDIEPADPFIAFGPTSDNVPDVAPADVDGDGTLDSPVAQALACIGPQGIDGCGFEAQLESMMQALDPMKPWNNGERPFLRDGALLAIAIVTDEVECSVKDWSVMGDDAFREVDPDTGAKGASSAICWNAGVQCNGPDASGTYSDCVAKDDGKLQPISRYTEYLVEELRGRQQKEVIMLGILGVPEVTAHDPSPPYQPIAGGADDLVVRDWKDGEYGLGGDILPAEWANGVRAEDKQFEFGIGPGCTGTTDGRVFTGQATPNTRVTEVCRSLDTTDPGGVEHVRCCIESICDDDFSAAIDCLTGLIGDSIDPAG
jgi:hypothetical protein